MKKTAGFTIIEIIVVVSIIAILSAVIYANFNEGSEASRDAKRQADLRNLQSAIELYRQEHGRYPAGCRPAGQWSGQSGTIYACLSGNQYIVDLAPKYISTLPTDPKLNGNDSGYVYTTNEDRTVYKLMVKNTVESEIVTIDHIFKSCSISTSAGVPCDPPGSPHVCDAAICDRLFTANSYSAQSPKPNECEPTNIQFQTSYAVWGGYANPVSTLVPGTQAYTANMERLTEAVACKI